MPAPGRNWANRQRSGIAGSAFTDIHLPFLLLGLCLAAQLYLVFCKSYNWDEFLHFSQVYQLRAGTLTQTLQVLHSRILWWAPDTSANLLIQMRAARLFIWGTHLLTLLMIYGVARNFTNAGGAFLSAFAYLTAGYVFTHGFAIRADPLVTATLMSALFLLAKDRLTLTKAISVGALVGMAGMLTMKAAFYAPCFAGLLWLKYQEAPRKREFLAFAALVPLAAILSFGAIYFYHAADIVEAAKPPPHTSSVGLYLRWITLDLPFAGYIGREILLAPVFFLMLVLTPRAFAISGLSRDRKIALIGFATPLVVLLFYRNTFPYFFVFLLAPVAVAIAPAFAMLRDRLGVFFITLILSAMPIFLAISEPTEVLKRQQAMVDYVHREFPEPTGYLDYSAMISDYPRILKYLTSGNGMRYYREQGEAVVGREIDRGNVPFIIANRDMILAALEGHAFPGSFLPADLAAMNGNYVRQWGALWREGKRIPAGNGAFAFEVRRAGSFVLAGGPFMIDGQPANNGTAIMLAKGHHVVTGGRQSGATLWRGERLPSPPPDIAADELFTNF